MGRLTLNMLLSFAQFEREVTAERIRDKIAASKARGMWMGGTPPLGYAPDGRSLAIVEEHAALIRDIYARYLELGNVRLLAEQLLGEGIASPQRINGKGRSFGGCAFTRGQLYYMLKNPIYAGDIPHKGKVYPGNHPAIIERDMWEAVQRQLSDNVKGKRQIREANANLLAGLLFDPAGEPLIPVHTSKPVPGSIAGGRQRYHYYVRKCDQLGTADPASPSLRLPAREIEQVVCQEMAALVANPLDLLARCSIAIAPAMLPALTERCARIRRSIANREREHVSKLVQRITVHPERLEITVATVRLAGLLGLEPDPSTPATIDLESRLRLTRSGLAVRLVQTDGTTATASPPDPALIRLIIKAREWRAGLESGQLTNAALARQEKVSPSYITRVTRLAYLAPAVVEAILAGRTRSGLDARTLLAPAAIPQSWEEQVAKFHVAPSPK